MNYIQISLPLPDMEEQAEILVALLSAIGYESFEEQTTHLIAFIPEDEFSKEAITEIAFVQSCDIKGELKVELLPDKNWNEVWESNYPSVVIDDKCYVRAPFHDPKPDMDYEIVIKPKMAFGTAHHETTAMMLEFILNNNIKDCKVLDMGCGSGVLAILASMKGANSVVAIDIDKWSYENTLENSEVNNIDNIEAQQGGAEIIIKWNDFDIIFANINKNILLRDMKYYSESLVEGGCIYFSGFYKDDLNDIEAEAEKYGMNLIENLEKNNWVAAKFIKNSIKIG